MQHDEHHDRNALSFGAVADVYERGRPGYPAEAIAWVLPPGASRVVDLGAGTGKATRVLTTLAAEVLAVEPDPGMRTALARVLPDVPVLEGTGEAIPLEDDWADAVVVAQAWHWMDPVAASREIGRVLRPDGTLGLVWNLRDETVPWVARMSALMHQPGERVMGVEHPAFAPPFARHERHEVRWVHEQSREEFLAMVASRSYVSTLEAAERQALLGRIEDLLDGDPALSGDVIAVPYVTYAHRASR
ncbi:class I SAM-dependent methyltransferase [Curtobacterium sp. MCBD17_019]|uniref:class I SAM-dependent methyltransferase n=1 Tax=Curtobacterium sp. MCBD17_019 TaxID=2175669 RepID=UPI000DA7F8E2|nr:class I SAM-dependent methyltransferase [Curtobacterium sp. MCBD17_019]PZE73911.1 SAM-dependent methyltransferase [Curtobacterium sp. MCBD17_019]